MSNIVLQAQQWLNQKYINFNGYISVKENGYPGTSMSKALISALQIELGITSPTGAFGPLTDRLCNETRLSLGDIDPIIQIIKYGLYSKGYDPHGISETYTVDMETAILELLNDTNIPNEKKYTYCDARNLRAILGFEEYKAVTGSIRYDTIVRDIQRELNNKYYDYVGICPTDGVYQKRTCTALIYALQAEEGLSTSIANGNFGPTTTANLPTISLSSIENKNFIKIVQYALYCYFCRSKEKINFVLGFNGLLDYHTVEALKRFQKFCGNEITGIIDKDTWMSLLVSTGNPNRMTSSGDVSTVMATPSHSQALLKFNCKTVGRYLTGVVIHDNNQIASKSLTANEIKYLFENGIAIFPIFQDARTYYIENPSENTIENYFTSAQGTIDAKKASEAAMNFGIPVGTYIYFAVDYDFNEEQVKSKVLPYFHAINNYENTNSFPYRIGIYGSRNTCSIISDACYASSSFVSDLSTGYSGNAGFPLPDNWDYDQIQEIKGISYNSETFDLDRNLTPATIRSFTSFSFIEYIPNEQKILSNLDFSKINALQLLFQKYLLLDYKNQKKIPCADYEKAYAIYDVIKEIRKTHSLRNPGTIMDLDQLNFVLPNVPLNKTTKITIENETNFTTTLIKQMQQSRAIFDLVASVFPAGDVLVGLLNVIEEYELNKNIYFDEMSENASSLEITKLLVDWAKDETYNILYNESSESLSKYAKALFESLTDTISGLISLKSAHDEWCSATGEYILYNGVKITSGDCYFRVRIEYDLGCEQTVYDVFSKKGMPIFIKCVADKVRSDVSRDGYLNESAIRNEISEWLENGYIPSQFHADRNGLFNEDIFGGMNYSDCYKYSEYYEYIKFVTENNLMNEISTISFEPNSLLTKEQLCLSLYTLSDHKEQNTLENFEDVCNESLPAINWGLQNEVVNAKSDTEFGVGDIVTLEYVVRCFYRLAQIKNLKTETYGSLIDSCLSTIQVDSEYYVELLWGMNNQILPLKNIESFNIKNFATRQEFAKMISKFVKNTIPSIS